MVPAGCPADMLHCHPRAQIYPLLQAAEEPPEIATTQNGAGELAGVVGRR